MRHEKLVQVKLALAEKYARLARLARSQPRQRSYLRHADQFRRQAEKLRLAR